MNFSKVLRDQYTNLPISLTEDTARGCTYIVTGANSGLGYECTKRLVRLQAGRVIMAVRNTKAGTDAARAIEKELGSLSNTTKLEVWELDLSKYNSVKAFVRRVEKNLERVDALIENAAVAASAWDGGEDGFDMNMTVNLVSTLLLTVLLMPHFRASGQKFGIVPRIAIIGSGAGFMEPGKEQLDKLDKENILEDLADQEKWGPTRAHMYPFSKLLLFLTYRELVAAAPTKNSGVIITYVNPGLCYTRLNRNAPAFSPINIQVVVGRMLMGRSAEMGSRTLIHGAVAGEECQGTYVSECEPKDYYVPEWAANESGRKTGAQCWRELATRLDKISPGCVGRAFQMK